MFAYRKNAQWQWTTTSKLFIKVEFWISDYLTWQNHPASSTSQWIEKSMKVLLKATETSAYENRNMEEDLIAVLYDYRSGIHAATGYTQAQLFFNRSVNDKLPTTTTTTTKKPKSTYYEYVYNKKLGHVSILNTIKLQTNLNKTPIKIL